ncbi:SEL1-like repeat protein [Sphingomonas profundi]|uniref:SEL1-like repeat protein n=1 Tax=Alterirhizorhabdus profundi TaxID=2681549 RepID=UPI0012E7D9B4|nr:SEL1-like repeat protein [Sphingomonas profundi]
MTAAATQSRRQESPEEQADIGLRLFERGDRAAAMPWIASAADAGEPRACYMLGVACFNGDHVEVDPVRAKALLRRAALAGIAPAAAALREIERAEAPTEPARADALLSDQAVAASVQALAILPEVPAAAMPGSLEAMLVEMLLPMLRARLETALPEAFARLARAAAAGLPPPQPGRASPPIS